MPISRLLDCIKDILVLPLRIKFVLLDLLHFRIMPNRLGKFVCTMSAAARPTCSAGKSQLDQTTTDQRAKNHGKEMNTAHKMQIQKIIPLPGSASPSHFRLTGSNGSSASET